MVFAPDIPPRHDDQVGKPGKGQNNLQPFHPIDQLKMPVGNAGVENSFHLLCLCLINYFRASHIYDKYFCKRKAIPACPLRGFLKILIQQKKMYSTLLEKQIIAIIFPQPVFILKNNFDLF
jgi:hypothetical protein